jgi:hypothetical protein
VAKTPDGKPLCFAFNKGVCGFRDRGPDANVDTICATSRDATNLSPITSAVTQPSDKCSAQAGTQCRYRRLS